MGMQQRHIPLLSLSAQVSFANTSNQKRREAMAMTMVMAMVSAMYQAIVSIFITFVRCIQHIV